MAHYQPLDGTKVFLDGSSYALGTIQENSDP